MRWRKPLWVPTADCLNKALQPIYLSAEFDGAQHLVAGTQSTAYRNARTGAIQWGDVIFSDQCPPNFRYWYSPWLTKHREQMTETERLLRALRFPDLLTDFRQLLLACQRGWVGASVPAIALRNGRNTRYIYLDGNHRMAAMHFWGHDLAPVSLVGSFDEQATIHTPLECSGDPRLWWETAWRHVYA